MIRGGPDVSDLATLAALSADVVRELAAAQGVCIRPLMRRVIDRETDTETTVAIACGSTREAVCPACALKARVLRMQQCAAGRSRMDEPTGKPRADLPTVSGLVVQICTKSPPGAVDPAPRRR